MRTAIAYSVQTCQLCRSTFQTSNKPVCCSSKIWLTSCTMYVQNVNKSAKKNQSIILSCLRMFFARSMDVYGKSAPVPLHHCRCCRCRFKDFFHEYQRVEYRYCTLGTEFLSEPISVTIVSTVVIPRATLAGTASLEIQNDNQERTTIRKVGE